MIPILISVNLKFTSALFPFFDAVFQRLFLRPVKYFLFITLLVIGWKVSAQNDSLPKRDSLLARDSILTDSIVVVAPVKQDTVRPVLQYAFGSDSFLYRKRLFFRFTHPVRYTVTEKVWVGKDAIFYAVIALLLFFALIRNSFSRYLADLYSSYFRTSIRQKQIKEQLLQSPLPSLAFNIFFVVSTSFFLSLIFKEFGFAPNYAFWLLAVYCALGLTVIYVGKFLILKFFGWVFQLSEAADTYIFVVFSTNKIIGISLLPFTIILAFTQGALSSAAVTLSFIVLGGLFVYRYFLAFISINQLLRINFLHFLIYLAALEVMPLLLINKLLFSFLSEIS